MPPYVYVAAGEVIALLELTTPLAEQAAVDNILFSLSGNVDLLQVSEQKLRKTALIYTNFYNDAAETAHFTGVVRRLKNFPTFSLIIMLNIMRRIRSKPWLMPSKKPLPTKTT